ncbi:paeninodin family lasso peptide [Evansella clarkii]|uniref:paeninodin family lasso peptide n=1 Tax=Evansella clarkii TaxID=79879 RepID=UPI0011177E00|nr:paeninodin family lasso peptide [Evansella clarkii]
MKKVWKQPILDLLDVNRTMGGAGDAQDDSYCTNANFDGKINKACANPDPGPGPGLGS